jgi:hypothetical protein
MAIHGMNNGRPVGRGWPLTLLLLLSGCGSLPLIACTSELGVELRPRERAIRVGESFQATATGISCGGRQRWRIEMEWSAVDTTIVAVERASGRITGLRPGTTAVAAIEPPYGSPWGSIRVQVLARGE